MVAWAGRKIPENYFHVLIAFYFTKKDFCCWFNRLNRKFCFWLIKFTFLCTQVCARFTCWAPKSPRHIVPRSCPYSCARRWIRLIEVARSLVVGWRPSADILRWVARRTRKTRRLATMANLLWRLASVVRMAISMWRRETFQSPSRWGWYPTTRRLILCHNWIHRCLAGRFVREPYS